MSEWSAILAIASNTRVHDGIRRYLQGLMYVPSFTFILCLVVIEKDS